MLKTAGHVMKHYKPCCVLFEDFRDRKNENATLSEFMGGIEKQASSLPSEDDSLILKGDMLEILAELFFKSFENDPKVGLSNYEPVALEEDYGVDGIGVNANGNKVPVQIKYRSNPTDLVLYAEIARTYASAMVQMKIPCEGPNSLYVFTTANAVTVSCNHVFGNMLRVINGNTIRQFIDNNVSFWETAYKEIESTLLG